MFSPTLHIDEHGNIIPEKEWQYLWIPQILEKLHQVTNPLPPFFPKPQALQSIIRGISNLCGDNIYSGILLLGEVLFLYSYNIISQDCAIDHNNNCLGAAVISMFSEAIQSRFGAVGIHLAVSSISRGKSNCAKVAIATAGNYPKGVVSHLTDSAARSYLSGALPFLYDDPTRDDVLKPLLMNSFGAGEMSTHRQKLSARCVPLITCNEHILDELLKADQRYPV